MKKVLCLICIPVCTIIQGCMSIPYPAPYPDRPSWATDFGYDSKGYWARINIGECHQTMRWIPAGSFIMGSPIDEKHRRKDEVQHKVNLPNGFWLADSECRQEMWSSIIGKVSKYLDKRDVSPKKPVVFVNYKEVEHFLNLVSIRTGCLVRLPTEAEWEYACRAGSKKAFSGFLWHQAVCGGRTDVSDFFYSLTDPRISDIKSKWSNRWGIYDMMGNAEEWCSDWYAPYSVESIKKSIEPPADKKSKAQ